MIIFYWKTIRLRFVGQSSNFYIKTDTKVYDSLHPLWIVIWSFFGSACKGNWSIYYQGENMTIFNLYIFDEKGSLLYYREWLRKKHTSMDKEEVITVKKYDLCFEIWRDSKIYCGISNPILFGHFCQVVYRNILAKSLNLSHFASRFFQYLLTYYA